MILPEDVEDWVALLEGPGVHDGLHVHILGQDSLSMRLIVIRLPQVVLRCVRVLVRLER